jgi:circadian clock protein KaiC
MRDKHPIHTTLSTDAMKILRRYETELGAMNVVLERALMGMDKLRFKEKIDAQSISSIIKRIKTGIPGFDEFLEGGVPEGFVIVVTGPPGCGKTTFSMQFLMEGLKNNERCIYFSFEEKGEQLIKSSIRYGWDMGRYIDKGFLEIFGFIMLSTEEMIEILEIFKPSRIVFDSINILSDGNEFRRSAQWRNILKEIKYRKITGLLITEKMHGLEVKDFDDFDFMSDGILFFDKKQMNELDSCKTYFIEIQKMRMTKINEMRHEFVFSEKGIALRGIAKKLVDLPRNADGQNPPEIITST